jgi:RecA/RadA recombinase
MNLALKEMAIRTRTVSTGSNAIDALLGGGVHTGMLTDLYGESGSGKSQMCFTLCSNCVREGSTAFFIDTVGTFRPERIMEISGMHEALESITYLRALTTSDQIKAIYKILEMDPLLVIVDSLTSLFSTEFSGPARHLAIMRYLHKLAHLALSMNCAVVVTNMVRNVPITIVDQAGRNVANAIVPSQQREYLGSSVSIYSHMRVKLEIIDITKSAFQAILLQPPGRGSASFAINARGITDQRV